MLKTVYHTSSIDSSINEVNSCVAYILRIAYIYIHDCYQEKSPLVRVDFLLFVFYERFIEYINLY